MCVKCCNAIAATGPGFKSNSSGRWQTGWKVKSEALYPYYCATNCSSSQGGVHSADESEWQHGTETNDMGGDMLEACHTLNRGLPDQSGSAPSAAGWACGDAGTNKCRILTIPERVCTSAVQVMRGESFFDCRTEEGWSSTAGGLSTWCRTTGEPPLNQGAECS